MGTPARKEGDGHRNEAERGFAPHSIGGQIDGIRRMVEEDRHGVDLIHQIAAAQAALGKIGNAILKAQIEADLVDAVTSADTEERQEKVRELMQVFSRYGHIRER